MNRNKVGAQENRYIALIRDNELRNPAPFSKTKILLMDDERTITEFPETKPLNRDSINFVEDVPIIHIAGISIPTHLDNFEYGMTFREVLFECLHGASLIQESLDYFLSDCHKSDMHGLTANFPQDKGYQGTSAYGRKGVGLTKRSNRFFVDQGQQRTLMAMFWIFQNKGSSGLYKKVRVCRPT